MDRELDQINVIPLVDVMLVLLVMNWRLALVAFLVALVLVIATLFIGAEIKGARRWIVIAGINIQPSEFLKPAFVVLIAWLFGESLAEIARYESDVMAVTAAEIQAVARASFDPARRVEVVIRGTGRAV